MLRVYRNADKDFVYNLSLPQNYYRQTNNEIDGNNACNVTNICQALELCNVVFPKGDYKQPEDNLMYFCRHNQEVLDYYKKIDNNAYEFWVNHPNDKNAIPPNENHYVLSFATNLWIGKKVTRFVTDYDVDKLPYEILIREKPVVMSGIFNGLHHIVTLVGVVIKQDSFAEKGKMVKFDDLVSLIFDDTYGKTYEYKTNKNGDDVFISTDKVLSDLKSLNSRTKWCHLFY